MKINKNNWKKNKKYIYGVYLIIKKGKIIWNKNGKKKFLKKFSEKILKINQLKI